MLDRMLVGRTAARRRWMFSLSRLTGLMDASRDQTPGRGRGRRGRSRQDAAREFCATLPEGVTTLAGQAEPRIARPSSCLLDALGVDTLPDGPDQLGAVVHAFMTRGPAAGPAVIVFEDLHGPTLRVSGCSSGSWPACSRLDVAGFVPAHELTRFFPWPFASIGGGRCTTCGSPPHACRRGVVPGDGRPLPSKTADAPVRADGGNPFFLEEILSVARDVEPDASATQPLPFTRRSCAGSWTG